MILSFSCTSSITFWGALGGLLGRRCVRNGASESLVNMQGSASCIDMIFRISDFIILSNRLYYFWGVFLGVSWLFGRAEFPSWKLPPPFVGRSWVPLGASWASGRTPRSLRDPYSLSFCPLPLLDSQNLLHILCIPSSAAASAKRSEIRRAALSPRRARHGV